MSEWQLLTCPFCGCEAEGPLKVNKFQGWEIRCSMFCVNMKWHKTPKDAVKHWNTRNTDTGVACFQPSSGATP